MKKAAVAQAQGGHVQLLTIKQVAARLGVHPTTVYDYINLAGLRVTRLSPKAVRVDEADLRMWVDERKHAS
jgi:excisionase family DNA binding protein